MNDDARNLPTAQNVQLHQPEATGTSEVKCTSEQVVSPTAGSLLRQAREAAGLQVGVLAASLKVPVKKLEALEANDFDLLPDIVFVRALASSVCRTLKIDVHPVLDVLPKNTISKVSTNGRGINAPFRTLGGGFGFFNWAWPLKPALLVVCVVLLIFSSLIFFLPANVRPSSDALDATSLAGRQPVSILAPASALTPAPGASTAAAAPLTQNSMSLVAPPLSRSAVPIVPVLPVLTDSPTPVGTANQERLPEVTGTVVFAAQAASWVEVTDAKKVVILRRTLSAGEVVGASGALPLTAIVGRADVTRVQIRGQAFDLAAVAKDNIAKFEVK